jgi:hypothetical protein
MKKQIIPVCILGFVFAVSLPACTSPAIKPVAAGGVSSAAVTKPEVVAAANFAIKEEEKAIRNIKETESAHLRLVTILEAEEQVVAGMNYRLKLKVTLDGKEKNAAATVWWQAWNKETPYKLTSWDWQ